MNILQAMNAPTLIDAARRFTDEGFSLVPLRGKKPSMVWDAMKARPSTIAQIEYWHEIGALNNIGIVTGAVSGHLVVIDCDGIEAILKFKAAFPSLAENTLTVVTGSRRGAHYYFYSNFIPDTTRITGEAWGNIELRAEGCYHVAPPSIHPDTGLKYVIGREKPILRVSSLTEVALWINGLRPRSDVRPARQPAPITSGSKYGAAALAGECAAVRAAGSGRNNALYAAALKLGSLVRDGHLARSEVESALMGAARDNGYTAKDGEREAWKTIQSGLSVGAESSRASKTNR